VYDGVALFVAMHVLLMALERMLLLQQELIWSGNYHISP
jgi:hypothetical protein